MTALEQLLNTYSQASVSEREKGTYFEELIACYLRNEATYRDLYSDVWTYAQWADLQGLDKRDTGIDLVAKTQGTGEFHAIQCKLYAEIRYLLKRDLPDLQVRSSVCDECNPLMTKPQSIDREYYFIKATRQNAREGIMPVFKEASR